MKAGIYYHCQLLLLSICLGSTLVLFVLYCNVVNTLNWVVSLTSSLENTLMMMHVEIRLVAIKLFAYLPKPIEIHLLESFLRDKHSAYKRGKDSLI